MQNFVVPLNKEFKSFDPLFFDPTVLLCNSLTRSSISSYTVSDFGFSAFSKEDADSIVHGAESCDIMESKLITDTKSLSLLFDNRIGKGLHTCSVSFGKLIDEIGGSIANRLMGCNQVADSHLYDNRSGDYGNQILDRVHNEPFEVHYGIHMSAVKVGDGSEIVGNLSISHEV